MPSLQALDLTLNPSDEPMAYPGPMVTSTCLLTESWLYPVQPVDERPVGEWIVEASDGPLRTGQTGLDSLLREAGEATISDRRPVLAVGSNASPGQLVHKFSVRSDAWLVPITRVTVSGLAVRHSAHISGAGYVPYAPAADDGARLDLVALWLDDVQLGRIDETEPNYDPVTIRDEARPAMLETGELIPAYQLYRSRWGLLRFEAGAAPAAATSQAKVFAALGKLSWFRALVPECGTGADSIAAALRADPRRRSNVQEALTREGLVAHSGL